MALSEQTSESLKKAEIHLRDALAFAARVEKPYVVRELGGIIAHLIIFKELRPCLIR